MACLRSSLSVVSFAAVAITVLSTLITETCPDGPGSEWIDPDTRAGSPEACSPSLTDSLGRPLQLIFSDEFNIDGRTFRDGDDPAWTAITGFPSGNEQSNAYDDSEAHVSTSGGKLQLKISNTDSILDLPNLTAGSTSRMSFTRPYTSAMVQSWNKFCFTEGVIEIKARMPGRPNIPGLWPAFWLMGNLGRATFESTTDHLWPFSFSHCPEQNDSQANQNPRQQQDINRCLGQNWTERFGLNPNSGRGAVEIDIFEVMPGEGISDYNSRVKKGLCAPLSPEELAAMSYSKPMVSSTLQLGPGIPFRADQRPNASSEGYPVNCAPDWSRQWYPELRPGNPQTYGPNSTLNVDNWGHYVAKDSGSMSRSDLLLQTDALSAISGLTADVFDSGGVFRLEWSSGDAGAVKWFLNDQLLYSVPAAAISKEMDITRGGRSLGRLLGREIPSEPVYLLMNIDVSSNWGWEECDPSSCSCCTNCSDPNCQVCRKKLQAFCKTLPATYEVDYIRVYQPRGSVSHGCSPDHHPTEGWIQSRRSRYVAPNMDEPLRPVYAGGAACQNSTECGGADRGQCKDAMCSCSKGWTGPRCLARSVGAADTCRPLHEVQIGGAHCDGQQNTGCGPGGKCVNITRRYDAFWQAVRDTPGSYRLVGSGMGRCKCKRGFYGPHCEKQAEMSASTGLPFDDMTQCSPDPTLSGEDLELLIERVCASTTGSRAANVVAACQDVLWRPWWRRPGGQYSVCGAWPRASWVVAAVMNETGECCRRLHSGSMVCREPQGQFVILLSVSASMLAVMAFIGCAVHRQLTGETSCRSFHKRKFQEDFCEEDEEQEGGGSSDEA